MGKVSWTSEDLKSKICKLQFGLHFFPWYTEFVWSAQSSILFVIYFYNEICEWLPFFIFFFLTWAFYDRSSKSTLERYALDICLLKTWVKIQDAYLNNTVSPTVLESDARGDGASLWFSHRVSCSTFVACMWVVLWKRIINRSKMWCQI